MRVITGFHAIEEEIRVLAKKVPEDGNKRKIRILFSSPGPRVKQIIAAAEKAGIPPEKTDARELDRLAEGLPPALRDHRGLLLVLETEETPVSLNAENRIRELADRESALVLILDSITDPHNTGAIIRSADQFGVDLVILPERRSAGDFEIISRTSAGASSWVPLAQVSNLVRITELLKNAGFWIYGADAGGTGLEEISFAEKAVLIMGSEGSGISRLLREKCDLLVSIRTEGKLDSLNVSVAAGILLYEISAGQNAPATSKGV
ncbi:23S rRNA (guanosine(2251)-2'-O)-methyltransferase RlmB [Brucepastera parasyntrophica]|uniref:23S rRNA (guanosine(2251)-2'-O)-methyltransferase RlmB n=1 Tax=Brucepastera parasyntrophica TaxID=2880008 RepID=UPI003F723D03